MNNIIYFTCVENEKNISEGGKVRDLAIKKWLESNNEINSKNIVLKNSKIGKLFNVFKYIRLLNYKDTTIFMQYPCTGIPMLGSNPIQKILKSVYKYILVKSNLRNNMIFDIADLPFEQSIDLEIKNLDKESIEDIEKTIFNLKNSKYIFASHSMQDYIKKKYKYSINSVVAVNGGINIDKIENYSEIYNKYSKYIDNKKINIIYAGTLNKGRQIEKIIKNFPKNDIYKLILIGEGGAWLEDNITSGNIIYLGALDQDSAAVLTSICDIGLIPYDNKRRYYNIAYPTKLSFYITSGIPFLSTNVTEVLDINKKYNIGFVDDISNWKSKIEALDKKNIEIEKIKINEVKENFYWENILCNSVFKDSERD